MGETRANNLRKTVRHVRKNLRMYLLYALYVVYFVYGLYFLREKTLTRSRERPGCTRETPSEEVTNKSAAARVCKKTNPTGSGKNTKTLIAISGQSRGPRTI